MSQTVVLYRSQYGSAKQYAQWIARELGVDCLDAREVKDVSRFECVVFGGSLYAGKILGAKEVDQLLQSWQGSLALFMVGAMPIPPAEDVLRIARQNLPRAIGQLQGGPFFFPGVLDGPKLSPVHRMMMGMLRHMLRKKEQLTAGEQELLDGAKRQVGRLDERAIVPLVNWARES